MMDQSTGYIRLHRKLLENPIWTVLEPSVLKVMLAFLLKANWRPVLWYDGQSQVQIPRGSFVTSYGKMAEFCRLSMKQVRLAFDHLGKLEFAAYGKTHRWTIVSVRNYDAYQSKTDDEGTADGSFRAESGHSKGTARARIEESKKGIKDTSLLRNVPENGLRAEMGTPPFGTPLEALPLEVNGTDHSGGKNGCIQKIPEGVRRVAAWIHTRHPKARRDIGVGQVEKKLAEILKNQHVPAQERDAYLYRIDRNHAGMCASQTWSKENGKFAKSLENWLAPSKERYLAEPELATPPVNGVGYREMEDWKRGFERDDNC